MQNSKLCVSNFCLDRLSLNLALDPLFQWVFKGTVLEIDSLWWHKGQWNTEYPIFCSRTLQRSTAVECLAVGTLWHPPMDDASHLRDPSGCRSSTTLDSSPLSRVTLTFSPAESEKRNTSAMCSTFTFSSKKSYYILEIWRRDVVLVVWKGGFCFGKISYKRPRICCNVFCIRCSVVGIIP